MEKEMRVLYIEGVAIRGGPESCAGVREGVGEALAGVRAGRAMEPRKPSSGRRRCPNERKASPTGAFSRAVAGSCVVREPVHVRDLSMRENREVPCSPVACCGGVAGRGGNAEAVSP